MGIMGCCSPKPLITENEYKFKIDYSNINNNYNDENDKENKDDINSYDNNKIDNNNNSKNNNNINNNNITNNNINNNNINNNNDNKKDNNEIISNENMENEKEENLKKNAKEKNESSFLSSEKNINSTKITDLDYENILSLYPSINEENNGKIELKKNIILENNSLYYGEFDIEKNMKEGRGILIYSDGAKYSGYFKNNMQNIKGTMHHVDGDIYEGEWLDDKANGKKEMGMEKKLGKMALIMKGIFLMVKKKEMVNMYGLMVLFMKENLKIMHFMEKVNIYGKIKENMRVIG